MPEPENTTPPMWYQRGPFFWCPVCRFRTRESGEIEAHMQSHMIHEEPAPEES